MLDAIKARFAQFFGEGSSEVTKEALLGGVAFADLLPYDAFDEETGVFVNKGSLGFVLEAIPLVGGDKSAEKIVASIFSELMEEGASLQCLLFADHRIDPFLNAWQSARQKKLDTLARLAQDRADFFRESKGMANRIFRLIFSYRGLKPNGTKTYAKHYLRFSCLWNWQNGDSKKYS